MIEVRYGGKGSDGNTPVVIIHNTLTKTWDQTVVYDASGTDVLYSKFLIRVEGLVHAQHVPGGRISDAPVWTLQDGTTPATATDAYNGIKSILSRPRLPLVVAVVDDATGADKEYLLEVEPATFENLRRDVNNGPRPISLSIVHLAGANCFRVSWTVEAALVACVDSYGQAAVPVVLSNRWSCDETLDQNFATTRTLAGDLRLSAPVAYLGDDYKRLCLPPLEKGFKRDTIRYTVDKTGLNCSWSINDKQVHTAAPWPATSIDGMHTESTSENGNVWYSEMSIRLTGSPECDKRLLIARAIDCIEARLKFIEKLSGGGIKQGKPNDGSSGLFLESSSVVDHIGEQNSVEARVRLRRVGEQYLQIGPLLSGGIGMPLEAPTTYSDAGQTAKYDPTQSPIPAVYGYVPQSGAGSERSPVALMFLACALQNPCSQTTSHAVGEDIPAKNFLTNEDERYGDTKVYRATVDVLQFSDRTKATDLADTATTNIYTFATMESNYYTTQNKVQLPIAGDPKTWTKTPRSLNMPSAGSDITAAQGKVTTLDTCRVLSLGLPICRRVIVYDAERIGSWPEIPTPADYTDGLLRGTLLNHTVSPLPATTGPNGKQQVFRLHARYLFAMNRPPADNETLSIGVLPFTKYKAGEIKFEPTKAYQTRVGP